jgi:plastocyanin
MHRRRWTAVAACAALAFPAAALARTKTVYAGQPPSDKALAHALGVTKAFQSKYNPDINDFFLHRVTVSSGDTVSFVLNGFHTVDLPGPSGEDLPLIVSSTSISGVNDVAGNPFWFNGRRSFAPNFQLAVPSGGHAYNGSARVDSGLSLAPGPPKPFKVTFTRPGVYKYFCDVHTGMIGYVVVRPKGQSVPSAKQDAVLLKAQASADILGAKQLAKAPVPAGQVSLGESNRNGVELYQMFPQRLRVRVGSVVRFSISRDSLEAHTASFGPAAYLKTLSSGVPLVPTPTQISFYPSGPSQPIPLNTTSHGNGFANTGVLDRDSGTPEPPSGAIKFTAPGTYKFICLLHPFMHGTVVVTR